MQKYEERPNLHLSQIAQEIRLFWKNNHTFEQSMHQRSNQEPFVFFEGPPSANGAPGAHHTLSMTIKDLFTRYKTMQGYYVRRKSGWDTHGLPVELQVEKKLGITKEAIGKAISIADYNQQCKETVMQYTGQFEAMNQAIGYWKDNTDPYITYERNYIESVWYLIKVLYNKELIYKGHSIQPYSPAAGTGLSAHELNQPGCYQLVKDLSIVAQFKQCGTTNDYFLAWTTTPWTLPANSALAVHPSIAYVKIATLNPYTQLPIQVILAEAAVERFFPTVQNDNQTTQTPSVAALPWEIVARYTGSALVGLRYEQLMPYVQPKGEAFKVIAADFVTTTDGTGIVHIAPTFGADDYRIAQKEQIPSILVDNEAGERVPIVDKQGRFVPEITDFAGRYVKADYEQAASNLPSVDVQIAQKLKQENKAFKVEKYEHSYPHCWRTNKPILYYPLDAWFVKTTAYKSLLVELNQTIQWKPASIGTGRFGNWLENVVDWNISRERYWGTPLPIWRTLDQKEEKCICSLAELAFEVEQSVVAGYMKQPLSKEIDLHRPYVDDIVLVSSNGEPMYRETAVLDVWFDSGAMPCAQWHYPFENMDIFEKSFPADFIAEGVDQTRGWFFTLHVLSTLLFETPAFKNVVVNGLVLDKNGNKMSKSQGNTIDPTELLDHYGPDATRWYMISNSHPWENLKFDTAGIEDVTRKFFITLHHTYNFFALYANLDQCYFTKPEPVVLHEIDRWIVSRCHTLIQTATQTYDAYEATTAARAIQEFVANDLSNWYVRLNRKRFWKNKHDPDKAAAYQTLYDCLIAVAKLMAPIAPFYADYLYQSLNNCTKKEIHASVHLADFPLAEVQWIDAALELRMQHVQTIVSLAHALRKKYKIKVRQPLPSVQIASAVLTAATDLTNLEELIKSEINVKSIHYLDGATHLLHKKARANFPLLGKRYGSKMKQLSEAILAFNQEEIFSLEEGKTHLLYLDEEEIPLTLEDVIVTTEDVPGWCVATEGAVTVALDLTLTDALHREGIARELVHRIQQLRKEMGLEVIDKITVCIQEGLPMLTEAVAAHKAYIATETQALQLTCGVLDAVSATVEINGMQAKLHLQKTTPA